MEKICKAILIPLLLSTLSVRAQFGQLLPLSFPGCIASYPLSISEKYTTNLIFPFSIFTVDLGTGDVIAKKIGRAENVLLVKANRAHFRSTNISVYLANGVLYSFLVSYSDTLSAFNYSFWKDSLPITPEQSPPKTLMIFSGSKVDAGTMEEDAALLKRSKGVLHVGASNGKVRLVLKNITIKDHLLWLGFRAHNGSPIDFQTDLLRFSIEDRKRTRRTSIQSIDLKPAYLPVPDILSGESRSSWAAGFSPFTIGRSKNLVVEWSEPNGGRRIRLLIKGKKLLKAKIYK